MATFNGKTVIWDIFNTSSVSLNDTSEHYCVQAALDIRGFDHSRTQKPQITRENCYF